MNRLFKSFLVGACLMLLLVSLGCAGGNYATTMPTSRAYNTHGDVDSPYPPYFHPSH